MSRLEYVTPDGRTLYQCRSCRAIQGRHHFWLRGYEDEGTLVVSVDCKRCTKAIGYAVRQGESIDSARALRRQQVEEAAVFTTPKQLDDFYSTQRLAVSR